MCSCGGEMNAWCYDCGDWVCDDCGCVGGRHDVGGRWGWQVTDESGAVIERGFAPSPAEARSEMIDALARTR